MEEWCEDLDSWVSEVSGVFHSGDDLRNKRCFGEVVGRLAHHIGWRAKKEIVSNSIQLLQSPA